MPISFTVSPDEKVTSITLGYSFNGCSGSQTFSDLNLETAPPTVICIPGPCSELLAPARRFSYTAGSRVDGPSTTVIGMFTFIDRAEGVANFTDYPGCGTALGVGWTAMRR